MHAKYAELARALTVLADKIEAATPEDRSVMEIAGTAWNIPVVDRHDIALVARRAERMITERAPEVFDEDDGFYVEASLARLRLLEAHTLPHLFNTNAGQAVPVVIFSVQAIHRWAEHIWPSQEVLEPGTVPFRLARAARQAKAKLDEVSASLGDIDKRISLIVEAHQAAEALPEDLADLKEARDAVQRLRDSARDNLGEIRRNLDSAKSASTSAESAAADAEGYAHKSSSAYRFTTSHNLAAAFEARSTAIAKSTWVWVAFLIAALFAVATLGHSRVSALTALVATSEPRWGSIALNLLLSMVSVGAPLWFAWVATKQIGQRFRLAEDYGFKASVAKAYEGYRSEAVALDASFASALFGVALDRLKEAPIRLVEQGTPGSPWHELMKDSKVDEAMRTVPNAAGRFAQFAEDILAQIKARKSADSSAASPATRADG